MAFVPRMSLVPLAILLVTAACTTASPSPVRASAGAQKTVTVRADTRDATSQAVAWQTTGIRIAAGTTVTIQATGQVSLTAAPEGDYKAYYGPFGPKGMAETLWQIAPVPTAPLGSLVGRVGEHDGFLIGEGGDFVIGESGTFYLTVNDPYVDGNSGQFTVVLTLRS